MYCASRCTSCAQGRSKVWLARRLAREVMGMLAHGCSAPLSCTSKTRDVQPLSGAQNCRSSRHLPCLNARRCLSCLDNNPLMDPTDMRGLALVVKRILTDVVFSGTDFGRAHNSARRGVVWVSALFRRKTLDQPSQWPTPINCLGGQLHSRQPPRR